MAHTEICPICSGFGKLSDTDKHICYGCDGKGWIEIADEPNLVVQRDILGKYHKVY